MANQTIDSGMEVDEFDGDTILCDGEIINQVIDEFGATVIIKDIDKTLDPSDAYDSYNITTKEKRTKAFINSYSEDDDEVQEGIFKAGTITLDFKLDDKDWVKVGNEIMFDKKWWQISEVNDGYAANNRFKITAQVERVQ